MKAVVRKWTPLVLAVFAVVGFCLVQAHTKKVEDQRIADQNSRCAKQTTASYVAFKGDASCIGWQRKYGSPMPIEG